MIAISRISVDICFYIVDVYVCDVAKENVSSKIFYNFEDINLPFEIVVTSSRVITCKPIYSELTWSLKVFICVTGNKRYSFSAGFVAYFDMSLAEKDLIIKKLPVENSFVKEEAKYKHVSFLVDNDETPHYKKHMIKIYN